tara:strand:- start:1760 stop:4180 length:2421 start_codon:yes stop_codon:yes gene_type:complete
MADNNNYILWFKEIKMEDLPFVGGKCASLGEMTQGLDNLGVTVPNGFAITVKAYEDFLAQNGLLNDIQGMLEQIDINDVNSLSTLAKKIRTEILKAPLLPDMEKSILESYKMLGNNATVAVRSSATAEDLPDASFAGQQESYLNIEGEKELLQAVKKVYASLFTDRAISYREHRKFSHKDVLLSVAVQQMVRSDKASSGVMFSIDTESGFNDVVFITSSYGLGEAVVQGSVNPDEFLVFKPSLRNNKKAIIRKNLGSKKIKMIYSDIKDDDVANKIKTVDVDQNISNKFSLNDADIIELAKQAVTIEQHYKKPMDIEWAKDGVDNKLYILQARPETVNSQQNNTSITKYELDKSACENLNTITHGRAIGQKIGAGKVNALKDVDDMASFNKGDILVTDMTDPDWEPIMQKAAAIVTNRGGRTCHAAIIARELGIPAVVGAGDATTKLKMGKEITVSCAEGDTGYIYEGNIPFKINKINVDSMPDAPCKIMMNVANPDGAFELSKIPNHGVGLARVEFIINRNIGIHPNALLNLDSQSKNIQDTINKAISGYDSPEEFYISKLADGVATIAASFFPNPVIVRLSDFKSNEYANLIGGESYEPNEENPMLGFRGASRYIDPSFKAAFELECKAIKRVREEIGLNNVEIMLPFVRTLEEARLSHDVLNEFGLVRGENGLRVIMMCEIPSNALLAEDFLEYFDGFSIGSNDLTQLTLGVDRDSSLVANSFDERNPAVKALLSQAIRACKKRNKYVGICGQGPSDYPDFALWLIDQGIDSISLNPDTVMETWMYLAKNSNKYKIHDKSTAI